MKQAIHKIYLSSNTIIDIKPHTINLHLATCRNYWWAELRMQSTVLQIPDASQPP